MYSGTTITDISAGVDRVCNFDRAADSKDKLNVIDSMYSNVQLEMLKPHSSADLLQLIGLEFRLLQESNRLREGLL